MLYSWVRPEHLYIRTGKHWDLSKYTSIPEYRLQAYLKRGLWILHIWGIMNTNSAVHSSSLPHLLTPGIRKGERGKTPFKIYINYKFREVTKIWVQWVCGQCFGLVFLPCKNNNVAPLFKGPLNSTDSYPVKKEITVSSLSVRNWLFHLHQTGICFRTLPPDLGMLYHPFF